MSSIPQVVRDQANMGTLQERRRRAKPFNPYYDAKYDYYDETQVRMTALLAYNLAIVDTGHQLLAHTSWLVYRVAGPGGTKRHFLLAAAEVPQCYKSAKE
eukprot:COSAG05_NODE_8281_length_718_cov_1.500808_1_plen_100_part_00